MTRIKIIKLVVTIYWFGFFFYPLDLNAQQYTIVGTVVEKDHHFRNKQGSEFINGAEVYFETSYATTKHRGNFDLNIVGVKKGHNINLKIKYKDWVVANSSKDLMENITVGRVDSVKIAICEKGYLEREYQYIFNQQFVRIEEKYEGQINQIKDQKEKFDQQLKQVSRRLRSSQSENLVLNDSLGMLRTKISELKGQIAAIEEEKELELSLIDESISEMLKQNLDDMDSTYQNTYRLFRDGKNSKIYDVIYPKDKVVKNLRGKIEIKKNTQKSIDKTYKEGYIAIAALLSDGKKKEAEDYYADLYLEDTTYVDLIEKYGDFLVDRGKYAKGIALLEKSIPFANEEDKILLLLDVMRAYTATENEDGMKTTYEALKQLYKDDYTGIAVVSHDFGAFFQQISKYNDAENYYNEASSFIKKAHADTTLSEYELEFLTSIEYNMFRSFGTLYDAWGDFESTINRNKKSALQLYQKATPLLKKAVQYEESYKEELIKKKKWNDSNRTGLAGTYIALGKNYRSLDSLDQAEIFYLRAVEVLKNIKNKNALAVNQYVLQLFFVLNNIGEIHRIRGHTEQAISYYKQSLDRLLELIWDSPITYDHYFIGTAQNVFIATVKEEHRGKWFYETYQVLDELKYMAKNNNNLSEIGAMYFTCGRIFDEQLRDCDLASKMFEISKVCLERDGFQNRGLWESSVLKMAKTAKCLDNFERSKQLYHFLLNHYQDSIGMNIDSITAADVILFGSNKYIEKAMMVKEQMAVLGIQHGNHLAYEKKKYDLAIQQFKSAIPLFENNPMLSRNSLLSLLALKREMDELDDYLLIGEGDLLILESYFQCASLDAAISKTDSVAIKIEKQKLINAILDELKENYPKHKELINLKRSVAYGTLSWWYVLGNQPLKAEEAAVYALQLDQSNTWISINLAHALLLTNKIDEAKELYTNLINNTSTLRLLKAIEEDFLLLKEKKIIGNELQEEIIEIELTLEEKIQILEEED